MTLDWSLRKPHSDPGLFSSQYYARFLNTLHFFSFSYLLLLLLHLQNSLFVQMILFILNTLNQNEVHWTLGIGVIYKHCHYFAEKQYLEEVIYGRMDKQMNNTWS